MSAIEPESKYLPPMVVNLCERLQHGQHVTRILESQLDTAQQNISLLQGQVRLANETVANLKKHFRETENILKGLLSGDVVNSRSLQSSSGDDQKCGSPEFASHLSKHVSVSVDSTTQSPRPEPNGDRLKLCDEKTESAKSPFAQQLRQVLDVLEEEPRKAAVIHHSESAAKPSNNCTCSECLLPGRKRQYVDTHNKGCGYGTSTCEAAQYQGGRHDDYRSLKQHLNGHTAVPSGQEPKGSFVSGRSDSLSGSGSYMNRCLGPCCSGERPHGDGYKMEKNSPVPLHYVGMHPPSVQRMAESSAKHESRHHNLPGHCGEKCQCHSFVNYAPYGYHVLETSPGLPESIRPISPTSRRKRSIIPVMACEEPPHLKYTKVKRVDGSKLTAHKTLQDFTRRRYLPYNPRYDLDLLIVPPPIPALDLLKDGLKSEDELATSAKPSSVVLHKCSPHVSSAVSMVSLLPTPSSAKQSLPHAVINNMFGFKSAVTVLPPIKEEKLDCRLSDTAPYLLDMPVSASDMNGAYHIGDDGPVLVSSSQEIVTAASV